MAERKDAAFETCQIVFWRGYVKCAFYAVPEGAEPVGSPFFRSREGSPVESGGVLEAHRALVDRLKEEGWEPLARGRAWYALTFRRRGWSPIDEPPPGEPPAVPAAIDAHTAAPPRSEPEPAPTLEPEPVLWEAAHRSRRQLALLAATAALIASAVVLGLTLFGTNSAQGKNRTHVPAAQSRQELPLHRKPAVAAVPAAHQSAKVTPTTIVVTGSRGDSWVEARVGSATGRSLFAGVVAPRQTVRVIAPVVWITFGAAENLNVRVNGRAPVPGTFNGTITALISHGRVRST
jgi:hypothetical protein